MPIWLRQLTNSRGFLAAFGLGVALVPVWLLTQWASSPTYVPLFREVEWGEVGTITDKLQGAGIEYELEKGGSVVVVRSVDLARARVLLARDGHGVGRPGLELFDRSSWGMTEFSQRVTYRRALEGELERTIGRLRGVERAQVHLALPESSPLRELNQPAEAAVVVSFGGGASLPPDVVRGIQYLVSNSVEQLTEDHVAILDDSGRLLSAPANSASPVGLSNQQLDLQHSVEASLAAKAHAILSDVLGERNSRIQVSAHLNFEQVDRTVETFDPDGQVIASEQRSEADGGGAAGNPGSSTIISNTFQNSRRLERMVGSVGGIERLTVAVLVNEAALQEEVGDPTRRAARMATLESLVRNAVGFDPARGDQISIAAIPFETEVVVDPATLPTSEPSGIDVVSLVERFFPQVVAIIGILVSFVLARRWLRVVVAETKPKALAAPAAQAAQAAQAALPGSQDLPALPALPQEQSLVRQLRDQIVEETKDLPSTAGQVVRAWLAEV